MCVPTGRKEKEYHTVTWELLGEQAIPAQSMWMTNNFFSCKVWQHRSISTAGSACHFSFHVLSGLWCWTCPEELLTDCLLQWVTRIKMFWASPWVLFICTFKMLWVSTGEKSPSLILYFWKFRLVDYFLVAQLTPGRLDKE